MGYTYPIDAKAMFEDRLEQFVTLGIPRPDAEAMRGAITDMWADAPGGWVYEWSALARRYEAAGQPFLASLVYGCAKFPVLANEARSTALAHQVRTYLAAAPTFPLHFERRLIDLPLKGATVSLPTHIFSASGEIAAAPVLMMSAGVDTWKMDVHPMCAAFAQHLGMTVLVFDQPGTGENPAPLTSDADETVLGLVEVARRLGNGKVAHMGISFGGNYAAMTGLSGAVDASIVLGGPVQAAFQQANLAVLPFGMRDIIGNDMGFDYQPSLDEFVTTGSKLARGELLSRTDNAPMLVINGEDDYFIPQADTLVFDGRADTEVHLIAETGHCAFSKLPEVLALIFRWLPAQLNSGTT